MIRYYITEGEIKNPVCISLVFRLSPDQSNAPFRPSTNGICIQICHLFTPFFFKRALVILIKLCPPEQNVYEKISANVPQNTNPPVLLSFF